MLSLLCCLVYPTASCLTFSCSPKVERALQFSVSAIFIGIYGILVWCYGALPVGAFEEMGWDPLLWRHWISGYINGFPFIGRWICPACWLLSCPWAKLLWNLGLPLMCKQKNVLQLLSLTLSGGTPSCVSFYSVGSSVASRLHQNGSCISTRVFETYILLDCARNFSVCSISSGLKSSLGRVTDHLGQTHVGLFSWKAQGLLQWYHSRLTGDERMWGRELGHQLLHGKSNQALFKLPWTFSEASCWVHDRECWDSCSEAAALCCFSTLEMRGRG